MKKILVGIVAFLAILSFAAQHNNGILSFIWDNLETISVSGSVTAFGFHDERFLVKIDGEGGSYYVLIPLRVIISEEAKLKIGDKIDLMGKALKGKKMLVIPTQISLNGKIVDLVEKLKEPRVRALELRKLRNPTAGNPRIRGHVKYEMKAPRMEKPNDFRMKAPKPEIMNKIKSRWNFFKLVWNNLPDGKVSGKVFGISSRDGRLFLEVTTGSGKVFVMFPALMFSKKDFMMDENTVIQASGKRLSTSDMVMIIPEKFFADGKEFDIVKRFEDMRKRLMKKRIEEIKPPVMDKKGPRF